MVKNGWGLIDHWILKSGISHKWFDELSILTEWFFHAGSDGLIFVWPPIYCVSLIFKCWGPLQFYLFLGRYLTFWVSAVSLLLLYIVWTAKDNRYDFIEIVIFFTEILNFNPSHPDPGRRGYIPITQKPSN